MRVGHLAPSRNELLRFEIVIVVDQLRVGGELAWGCNI